MMHRLQAIGSEWRAVPLLKRTPDEMLVGSSAKATAQLLPHRVNSAPRDYAQRYCMQIDLIQPGKPAQNAYIERFNRTYREEVLAIHLFRTLKEVRELTDH